MQNNSAIIILFIALSIVLGVMFSIDKWSSEMATTGFGTTGTGVSKNELYTGEVKNLKGRFDYNGEAENTSIDIPGSLALPQKSLEDNVQTQSYTTKAKVSFASQGQSKAFNSSDLNNPILQENNRTTADINATLKARTTEVKPTAKNTTKTDTKTKSADTKKQNGKMGEPGEPGINGSLPIGDATWWMIILVGSYAGMTLLKGQKAEIKQSV